jgi:hypothetical protein
MLSDVSGSSDPDPVPHNLHTLNEKEKIVFQSDIKWQFLHSWEYCTLLKV